MSDNEILENGADSQETETVEPRFVIEPIGEIGDEEKEYQVTDREQTPSPDEQKEPHKPNRAEKRINQLYAQSKKWQEYASNLEQKNFELAKQLEQHQGIVKQQQTETLKFTEEQLETQLAKAIEDGDSVAHAKALRRLNEIQFQRFVGGSQSFQASPPNESTPPAQAAQQQTVDQSFVAPQHQQQVAQPPAALPSQNVQDWLDRNDWFQKPENKPYAQMAETIEQQLVQVEGFAQESEELYRELDVRLSRAAPHLYGSQSQPARNVVAPAGRNTRSSTSGNKFTSGDAQTMINTKLGLDPNDKAHREAFVKYRSGVYQ